MQQPFESGKNAKKLGIDLTRRFVVVKEIASNGECGFSMPAKIRSIVRLREDDKTRCPSFWVDGIEENYAYIFWECLAYADEPEQKPKFKVGDKVEIKNKSLCGCLSGSCVYAKGSPWFVTKIYGDGSGINSENCIVVDNEKDPTSGDYFAPQDLELVEEAQPLTFKEGGMYRVKNENKHQEEKEYILYIKSGKQIVVSCNYPENAFDSFGENAWAEREILEDLTGKEFEHYQYKNPKYFGAADYGLIQETINKLTNPEPKGSIIKKCMSNAFEFVKNMSLSDDEKVLRRAGFHDNDGKVTLELVKSVLHLEAKERGFKNYEELESMTNVTDHLSVLEVDTLVTKHAATILDAAKKIVASEEKKKK